MDVTCLIVDVARVVVDPFHVIADSNNKRMDEARRMEQDIYWKRKVQIRKKIFLVGREKLNEEREQKVDKLLDNIIFNLKSADDGELIRRGNSLKRWREPILNHFDNHSS